MNKGRTETYLKCNGKADKGAIEALKGSRDNMKVYVSKVADLIEESLGIA